MLVDPFANGWANGSTNVFRSSICLTSPPQYSGGKAANWARSKSSARRQLNYLGTDAYCILIQLGSPAGGPRLPHGVGMASMATSGHRPFGDDRQGRSGR